LLAAARLLGHGPHAVSMNDIASEVGFTAPALYAYFDSKEAIFAELGKLLDRELAEVLAPASTAGASFRDRLSLLLRRQLAWCDRRRDVFAAMLALKTSGQSFDSRGSRYFGRAPGQFLVELIGWFERELGGESLGDCTAEEAASVFMGLCHGFMLRWLTTGADGELAGKTDRILELFFHGTLGAPRRRRIPRSNRGPSHA